MIDPIDGTKSFILGQLHWATLIALHDGERVVAGVAHQPYVGESFVATRRRNAPSGGAAASGARCARARAARSATPRSPAPIPTCSGRAETLAAFHRVSARARLTRYGGDCYAYCLLAMGLIDIVIESSLQAYDIQALIPIIEAAGGIITDWSGERCDDGGDVVACGDRALHAQVLELLAAHRRSDRTRNCHEEASDG